MIEQLNVENAGLVELQQEGRVLEIRMVKPKVNAICHRLSRAVERSALFLQNNDELQVGMLTSGIPRAFSAGLDFNETASPSGQEVDESSTRGGFGGITRLWDLKKPLIAVVNAPAIGGGMELALACDLIVMAEDAYFQLPELQRGLLPDGGGLQRLPRRIPYHVATAMIWTGEAMSAAEAKTWGLVYRVVPPAELSALAWSIARRMASDAPLAQQAFKEVMRNIDGMPERQSMEIRADSGPEYAIYARMLASHDMIEGQRAFLEKRPPKWKGC
ncbi:enoyl-CoA hydratase/isomerase family protein [Rhizobium sp. TH2]|uniref:enoyl-CoA hydratase-related protein n=1 Tax=Rhizobium sp. TH2 TaxID=2775403 RepID=UPI002157134A|nr:enoyl-CoA hydratase-related protein [Rhizobium sp. TH2]UVC10541.1 enoyl-CoA hydratase/isomerase family protein [Rhizobium sp. TH2]